MQVSESHQAIIAERVQALCQRLADHQGTLPPRAHARDLLFEHVQSPALRAHMLAVEVSMRTYAERFGDDVERYGITGLLHDFDYQAHPQPTEHPMVGCGLLVDRGYPRDVIEAIMGHATYTGTARTTRLAKTLFAVDELTGFLTAVAYVRPNGLEGLRFKSFRKKFKTPSFAAGVNRDEVTQGAEELGVPLAEHVAVLATALQSAFPAFPRIDEAAGGGD